MLEEALRIAQRRIPGVKWRIEDGTVLGTVYGTELCIILNGDRAFVSVSGKRRSRPSRDLEDVVDVLRDSIVRRRDALNRALGE